MTDVPEEAQPAFLTTRWIIFIAAIVIYIVFVQWTGAFFRGILPGLYWLHTGYSSIHILLLLVIGIVGLLLVIIGIVSLIRGRRDRWLEIGLILMATVILLLFTSGIVFADAHQDTVTQEERTYHLSAYTTWLESHFSVFRCGAAGLFCRRQYFHAQDLPVLRPGDRYEFHVAGEQVYVLLANAEDDPIAELQEHTLYTFSPGEEAP